MSERDDLYRVMIESNNLGVHFSRHGGHQMAIMFHLQALKLAEAVMGNLSADYGDALYNLGNTFADAGNTEMALHYLLAAEQHAAVRGADGNAGAVHLLNSIAYVYEAAGDYPQAVKYLEAALGKFRKLAEHGGAAEEHMRYTYYLGGVCERAGDTQKALAYYNDTLLLVKRHSVAYHPSLLNCIADVMTARGSLERSLELRAQAAEQIKAVIGAGSISYAQSMKKLSIIHQSLGDLPRAISAMGECISIKRAVLGETSKETIRDTLAYIELHTKSGDRARAQKLFIELLGKISSDLSNYDDMIRELAELYRGFGDINRLNSLFRVKE